MEARVAFGEDHRSSYPVGATQGEEKSPSRLCCMQQGDVHLHDSAQELQPRHRRQCNRGHSLSRASLPPCQLTRMLVWSDGVF